MNRTAFYAGSFDPLTNGHLDIIRRGLLMFDRLVVGIGVHHGKAPMFSGDERIAMIEHEIVRLGAADRARAVTFAGLAVDAARAYSASVLLRGLRNGADFDYEAQMSGMNAAMAPDVETVFLAASPSVAHITATLVRQIASMGGDVSPFVPQAIAARLSQRSKS